MANGERLEIRITGFGGQGVILMGQILGRAAALYDGRHAILAQNYGPEARGSACRADLIVAGEPIDYPRVHTARLLLALSQDGYLQNRPTLAAGGLLLYDEDLVKLQEEKFAPPATGNGNGNGHAPLRPVIEAVPATRLASEMGGRIMANLVMLGFAVGLTEVVSLEAAEQAVKTSVPRGTEALNLAALHRGIDFARDLLAQPAGDAALTGQPRQIFQL